MNLRFATRELRAHRKRAERGAFWRPQTVRERYVDFRAIGRKLDSAKEDWMRRCGPAATELTAALVDEAAALVAERDARGLAALRDRPPSKFKMWGRLAGKMRGEMRELSAYGRQCVKDEKERAMAGLDARRKRREGETYAVAPSTVKRVASPLSDDVDVDWDEAADELMDDDELADFQDARADALAGMVGSRVAETVAQQGMSLLRTGADLAMAAAALAPLALAAMDRGLNQSANACLNESYNMGRALGISDELRDDAEGIRAGIYSALLDNNCCEVCEPLDGMAFFPDQEEFFAYMDGNPDCVGVEYGNSCRCMMFLEYEDMVPPMPGEEGVPFPEWTPPPPPEGPPAMPPAAVTEESLTAAADYVVKRTWSYEGGTRIKGGLSASEVGTLAQSFAKAGSPVYERVASVRMYREAAEWEKQCSKVFGKASAKNVAAYWDHAKDTIAIGPKWSQEDVVMHELGHVVTTRVTHPYLDYIHRFNADLTFDRHTAYAATSATESFAESYMAYMAAGGKAPALSKLQETFNAVEEVLRAVS